MEWRKLGGVENYDYFVYGVIFWVRVEWLYEKFVDFLFVDMFDDGIRYVLVVVFGSKVGLILVWFLLEFGFFNGNMLL